MDQQQVDQHNPVDFSAAFYFALSRYSVDPGASRESGSDTLYDEHIRARRVRSFKLDTPARLEAFLTDEKSSITCHLRGVGDAAFIYGKAATASCYNLAMTLSQVLSTIACSLAPSAAGTLDLSSVCVEVVQRRPIPEALC
jgi:hypothetical protein